MRILTRYILKEVLSHALLGGALFTFVLFMRDLGHILELVVRESAPLADVLKIFLYSLPNTLTVTVPMSVLVGILLGLSRLAADSEITAMRAAGIGIWRFIGIVGAFAVIAWIIGLANSTWLGPQSARSLLNLEASLMDSQASYEIQPRVFYEDFRNYVLYIQDVRGSVGSANWRRIFMVDISDPNAPKVTTAESATVVDGGDRVLRMRLRNGSQHETSASDLRQYDVSTFNNTDIPLQLSSGTVRPGRNDTPILAMTNAELQEHAKAPGGRWFYIERQKRLAYPTACLVLMLVGVPLGLSSKKGGKSGGFVLTVLLVFLYYFLSSTGVALGRQNKLPPWLAVWAANIIFGMGGLLLLRQMSVGGSVLNAITSLASFTRSSRKKDEHESQTVAASRNNSHRSRRGRFPLLIDEYVLREFLTTFFLVLVSFVMLLLVFTFFELLGDIIRNRSPLVTVGDYLLNLTPSMIYTITPLSVLIAVLATFGTLTRNSELTAMKATGISTYRLLVPIFTVAAMLSVALFSFEELYLPLANRKQEALRSSIKGRPAQTFLRPDQKWIFGLEDATGPGRIFYYQFFDPDQDRFANLSIFEFDRETFLMSRRIYAANAHWEKDMHRWVFENGWVRTFNGEEVTGFTTFDVSTFSEIHESPAYFKKESLQSSEMSFPQLKRYIRDLSQSGFDTMRLRVQLNHKLAYPLISLVMAILAVPFALSMGRRGSLAGIAVAIGVAIAYWVIAGIFEAMGNVNMLPPLLAAWSPDILFGLTGGYLLLRSPT